MNNLVFTIITRNFIPQGYLALRRMQKLNPKCNYRAFIIDEELITFQEKGIVFESIDKIHPIYTKYKANKDILRWAHKPILLKTLIEHYNKVIYIDPDIYFVHNFDLLFDEVDGILLTKHHRSLIPDRGQYKCLFTDGFFNAGFVGATSKGKLALSWWETVIQWKCEKNYSEGLFDDQKYLDVMALEFNDTVKICKQLGCNLAVWNRDTIKTYRSNTKWFCEKDNSPVVFLHITKKGNTAKDSALDFYQAQYHKNVNRLTKLLNGGTPPVKNI